MARNTKWQDDYWLLLLQLYLKKPVGVKPMYSRGMVQLCMELHIAPQVLFNKMCEIANVETPRIERIWQQYGENPRRSTAATPDERIRQQRLVLRWRGGAGNL